MVKKTQNTESSTDTQAEVEVLCLRCLVLKRCHFKMIYSFQPNYRVTLISVYWAKELGKKAEITLKWQQQEPCWIRLQCTRIER